MDSLAASTASTAGIRCVFKTSAEAIGAPTTKLVRTIGIIGVRRMAPPCDCLVRFPLVSVGLPVFQRRFPALALGNFAANRLFCKGRVTDDGPNIDEIPSIFPVIREFDGRRAVRWSLPAQPPS